MIKMLINFAAIVSTFATFAAHAQTFSLDFTQVGNPSNSVVGGSFSVLATLNATADGSGNYNVTGISGTLTDNGTSYAITGLIAGTLDPANNYSFDNKINAAGGSAPFSLDTAGLAFYVAGETQSGTPVDPYAAFNLYSYGTAAGLSTTVSNNVNAVFQGNLSIAAVPEPSTYALMLGGLGLVGFVARRRRGA
jgi:hypothetical protein